jgi:hypothetical protein
MKTPEQKREQLQKANGQWVRLVNVADVDMVSTKLTIHIHGKLDYTEDDRTYCVFNQDGHGHGTNSVSFQLSHVEDIFTQPSGIVEITLF